MRKHRSATPCHPPSRAIVSVFINPPPKHLPRLLYQHPVGKIARPNPTRRPFRAPSPIHRAAAPAVTSSPLPRPVGESHTAVVYGRGPVAATVEGCVFMSSTGGIGPRGAGGRSVWDQRGDRYAPPPPPPSESCWASVVLQTVAKGV